METLIKIFSEKSYSDEVINRIEDNKNYTKTTYRIDIKMPAQDKNK